MPRKKTKEKQRRRRNSEKYAFSDSEDEEEGVLNIGSVRVRVAQDGNVAHMRRVGDDARMGKEKHIREEETFQVDEVTVEDFSESQEGDLDSDIADYFRNVGVDAESSTCSESPEDDVVQDSGSSGFGSDSTAQRHWKLLEEFSRSRIGCEGAIEDILHDYDSSGTSKSDPTTDVDGFCSDEDSFRHTANRTTTTVLTHEDLAKLSLEERYPVQMRQARMPTTNAFGTNGKSVKNGSKTPKGKKRLPGEKARCRRAGIEARRTERALDRGLDLVSINQQLWDFVEEGDEDVYVFPPHTKRDCMRIVKLASLYGCKAGAQGAGKRRTVVVQRTSNSRIPKGDGGLKIEHMMAMSNAVASNGAEEVSRRYKQKSFAGSVRAKADHDSDQETELVHTADLQKSARSRMSRSIRFVSRGCIYDNGDDENDGVVAAGNSIEVRRYAGLGEEEIQEDRFMRGVDETIGSVETDSCTRESTRLEKWEGSLSHSITEVQESVGDQFTLPVFEHQKTTSMDRASSKNDHDTSVSNRPSGYYGFSGRGASAAEGITNPSRLLGLGLALGIGADIFGARGPLDHTAEVDVVHVNTKGTYDRKRDLADDHASMSPLLPQMSKSALKRTKNRRSISRVERSPKTSSTHVPKKPEIGASDDFSSWERHTTGVGSRLLAKWGFSGAGSGLGKEGRGIAEPLKAKPRAKKLGLGAER